MIERLAINLNKGTYFHKIFLYYLLFLIPILAISTTAYFYIRQSVIKDIDKNNIGFVNAAVVSIDNEFKELNQITHILDNDVSNAYLSMKNAKDISEFTGENILQLDKLKNDLIKIRSVKSSIDSLFLFFIKKGILLSNEGTFNYQQYLEYYNQYKNYNSEYWNKFGQNGKYFSTLATSKLNKRLSTEKDEVIQKDVIPVKVSFEVFGIPNLIMVMNIDEDYILNLIKNYKTSDANEIFILDDDGNVISNTNREMLYNSDYRNLIQYKEGQETGKKVWFGNQDYILYTRKLEFTNWHVYSMIPQKDFFQNSDFVLKVLISINLLLLLCGIVTAYIFSRRLYSPIKNLVSILGNNRLERSVSGNHAEAINKNEIELIRNNVNSLQKNSYYLKDRIMKIEPYIREKIVETLMRSDNLSMNEGDLTEMLTENNMKLDLKYSMVSLFHLYYTSEFYKDFSSNEQNLVKNGLYTYIHDSIVNKYKNSVLIKADENNFNTILNFDDAKSIDEFKLILEEVFFTLKYDYSYIKLFVALGSMEQKLTDIPNSYNKAREMFKFINVNENNCIMDSSVLNIEIELSKVENVYFPVHLEEKFINVLLENKKQEISQIISDVFEENFKQGKFIIKLKKLSQLLLDVCEKIAVKNCLDTAQIDSYKGTILSNLDNFEEVKMLFTQLFSFIGDNISKEAPERKQMLEEYVQIHYAEDLSLEKMTEDLNLKNPNYLSRIFKEQTGQNFSYYLALVRVEKAKELLASSDLSVEEIGAKVGFFNRNTFGRIFKKYVGVSPGTFRVIKN